MAQNTSFPNYVKKYEKLMNIIHECLKKNSGKERSFNLDINKDQYIISKVFHKIPDSNEGKKIPEDLLKDLPFTDKYIERMAFVDMSVLSMTYGEKRNLLKIYKRSSVKDQKLIYDLYKEIHLDLQQIQIMDSLEKNIVNSNIENSTNQKNINRLLNLDYKNFKDPKFLASCVELLSSKSFRDSIFDSLINGNQTLQKFKVDINYLFKDLDSENESDKENSNSLKKIWEYAMSENFIHKVIYFTSLLDLEGRIIVKKSLDREVNSYINSFLENSDTVSKYLEEFVKPKNKDLKTFEEKMEIFTIKDEEDFENSWKKDKSISFDKIDFDQVFQDVFKNNKKINFKNQKDIINRFRNIIYFLIELRFTKTEQAPVYNFIMKEMNKNAENLSEDTKEVFEIINVIKNNKIFENDSSFKENILNGIREEFSNIKDNVMKHLIIDKHDYELFESLLKEFVGIINEIKTFNFEKEKFNKFTLFFNKLSENKNTLKIFLINLIRNENFDNIEKIISKFSFFNLNPVIKEQVVKFVMKTINELIKLLNEAVLANHQNEILEKQKELQKRNNSEIKSKKNKMTLEDLEKFKLKLEDSLQKELNSYKRELIITSQSKIIEVEKFLSFSGNTIDFILNHYFGFKKNVIATKKIKYVKV